MKLKAIINPFSLIGVSCLLGLIWGIPERTNVLIFLCCSLVPITIGYFVYRFSLIDLVDLNS